MIDRDTLSGGGITRRLAVALLVCAVAQSRGEALAQTRGADGRALPRFASLKSDPVNLRTGPGRKYPKAWVFRRAGLPVEILQQHQAWRRVRDSEGADGWVLGALLSRRRTALVLYGQSSNAGSPVYVDLKTAARSDAATVAKLELGALISIKSCDRTWCEATVGTFAGYVPQNVLWGVYPDEVVK